MNNFFRNFLFLSLLFLYGCGALPTDTVNQDTSELEVIFQGNTQKEEIQTLAIDNCDGKSDLSRTEERSQSVDVTLSSEVAAKIGASAEVISAEVQAAVGAATTQSGSRSMSIQLTAPPKTHMQFQLVWTGNEQIGVVQNLRGANLPIAFRGFAPTDVRIKSQNDIGCPNSESVQEVVEAQPTTEPTVTQPPPSEQVLGDNLLTDGDFENGLGAWSYTQRHAAGLMYPSTGYSGNGVCSQQNLTENDAMGWVGIGHDVLVQAGKTYKYSAWVKWENVTAFNAHVEWRTPTEYPPAFQVVDGTNNNWQLWEATFTVPDDVTQLRLAFWHGVKNNQLNVFGGVMCVDEVSLRQVH